MPGSSTGGHDLVVLAIPGVQRFIEESRTTRDASSASRIISQLLLAGVEEAGAEPVVPSAVPTSADGLPNRMVFLVPAGSGADVARRVAAAITDTWNGLLDTTFKQDGKPRTERTPDFPLVEWAVAPPDPSYREQYAKAAATLAVRKRTRTFSPQSVQGGWRSRAGVCSQSPGWPAVPVPQKGVRPFDKTEQLSAPNWVKRQFERSKGGESTLAVPSTWSIASTPYRVWLYGSDQEVPQDVRKKRDKLERRCHGRGSTDAAVPSISAARDSLLGGWASCVYPERWSERHLAEDGIPDEQRAYIAAKGARHARNLAKAVAKAGGPQLTPYFAIIKQDLDNLGRHTTNLLTQSDSADTHKELSASLVALAKKQQEVVKRHDGFTMYAGGDDLLALVPMSEALDCAKDLHAIDTGGPKASTAVLYVHAGASLRGSLMAAHALLDLKAKVVPRKHAIAIGYQKRSGSAATTVLPWSDVRILDGLIECLAGPLSRRIIGTLRVGYAPGRAAAGQAPAYLSELHGRRDRAPRELHMAELYAAELTRIAARHLPPRAEPGKVGSLLERAARAEKSSECEGTPVAVLTVAQFIASGGKDGGGDD